MTHESKNELNTNLHKRVIIFLIFILLLTLLISSCSSKGKDEVKGSAYYKDIIKNAELLYFGEDEQFEYNIYDGYAEITGVSSWDNIEGKNVVFPHKIDGYPVWVINGSYERANSVTFPDQLREMRATFWMSNIRTVVIPDSVYYIDDHAFYLCCLSYIDLGNGVEEIGNRAFAFDDPEANWGSYYYTKNSKSGLTEIRLPASLKKIGNNAFAYHRNLKRIYIYSKNVVSYDDDEFDLRFTFMDAPLEEIHVQSGSTALTYCVDRDSYKEKTIIMKN